MRRGNRYEDNGTLVELDPTLFLYAALILLVVLLVALPAAGRRPLPEPGARRAEPVAPASGNPSDLHVIRIDQAKQVHWDGKISNQENLASRLRDLRSQGWRGGIVVETDKSLSVADAVDVLGLVPANGLRLAGIVVRPETPPPVAPPILPPVTSPEPVIQPSAPAAPEPPHLVIPPDAPSANTPPP